MDTFTLRRAYARHWRPSWPSTFAETMSDPTTRAQLEECAHAVPAFTRRPAQRTAYTAHTAPSATPSPAPRTPRTYQIPRCHHCGRVTGHLFTSHAPDCPWLPL